MADLRLSDAEREQASRVLGDHYADGRLSAEEHGERFEAVWSARTRSQLRPLFADLPGGAPVRAEPALAWAAPRRAARSRRPAGPPLPFKVMLVLGLLVVLVSEPWVFFVALGLWCLLAGRSGIGGDRTPVWGDRHGGLPRRS